LVSSEMASFSLWLSIRTEDQIRHESINRWANSGTTSNRGLLHPLIKLSIEYPNMANNIDFLPAHVRGW
jgi:hypothetical protein